MNGILCMNKPQGFTSFDLIAKLRGIMKIKRLGHAGTLDPMAEGVLPVFVGKATKACDILPRNDKSYIAGFEFGIETDTQDTTGRITEKYNKKVCCEDIRKILDRFKGDIMQTPPMYSAVSVNGERLYKLARKGIAVEVPEHQVHISELEIISFDEETQAGKLSITCSKGTYVRTLINDIGKCLGCGGVMNSLVRTSSNGFTLEECYGFDEVEKLCSLGRISEIIIPVNTIFSELPSIKLNEQLTCMYKNGVKLSTGNIDGISDAVRYTVYGADGGFIGTARTDTENGILRAEKNFF